MKIYLASILEKQNFGPGRLIGIVNGRKPDHIKIDFKFPPLTPNSSLIDEYNQNKDANAQLASDTFIEKYTSQLQEFITSVPDVGQLPFQDGDTLVSWERANRTNYRKILAPFLEKLGYEVVLN